MAKQITPDELVKYCRATVRTMPIARSILEEMQPKLRQRVLLAVQTQNPENELRDPIGLGRDPGRGHRTGDRLGRSQKGNHHDRALGRAATVNTLSAS